MFAVPTYAFIAAIAALAAGGLVHAAGRGFHPLPVRHLAAVQAATVLLVLRAFASGATAMTGIEAISNAVPAFKPTGWRNARITLSWMTGLLIAMFAGVLAITRLAWIVPVASQTMLSQLAHLSFGDGPVYVYIQAATAAVLLLAANTSYNDFPRVLFLMARDRQAPRSFLEAQACQLAELVHDLGGLLALVPHVEDDVARLGDLVVVAALGVAMGAQRVELAGKILAMASEQVARVRVPGH